MTPDKMFDNYSKLKKERDMLSYQISHFAGITRDDVIEALTFATPESEDRVQTSGTSDKTAKIAMNYEKIMDRENDDYYEFMVGQFKKLDGEINFFEDAIRQMGDPRTSVIFEMLDGALTWDQIADSYHVSRSTLRNYRHAAIKEVEKQYELREEMELQFLMS